MTLEDHFERGRLNPNLGSLPGHSVEPDPVVPGRLDRADSDDEPGSPSRDLSTQGRGRLLHQHQGEAEDRAATPEIVLLREQEVMQLLQAVELLLPAGCARLVQGTCGIVVARIHVMAENL
jgi:hypothetical protein